MFLLRSVCLFVCLIIIVSVIIKVFAFGFVTNDTQGGASVKEAFDGCELTGEWREGVDEDGDDDEVSCYGEKSSTSRCHQTTNHITETSATPPAAARRAGQRPRVEDRDRPRYTTTRTDAPGSGTSAPGSGQAPAEGLDAETPY